MSDSTHPAPPPAACLLPLLSSRAAVLDTLVDRVHCADALSLLRKLPAGSVDAFIFDPPYNLTNLSFEGLQDWEALWAELRRAAKSPHTPMIIFSQQPFTTDLICGNRAEFRYEIIWEKTMPVGYLDANRRPLRAHENILVFGQAMPNYYPVFEETSQLVSEAVRKGSADHYSAHIHIGTYKDDGSRYPRSVWKFAQRDWAFKNTSSVHPTQKPLPLMERLILCYTKPGNLVVDVFAGSGSTCVAARNTNRHYIGCDNGTDSKTGKLWVVIAAQRLAVPYTTGMFADIA